MLDDVYVRIRRANTDALTRVSSSGMVCAGLQTKVSCPSVHHSVVLFYTTHQSALPRLLIQ